MPAAIAKDFLDQRVRLGWRSLPRAHRILLPRGRRGREVAGPVRPVVWEGTDGANPSAPIPINGHQRASRR